MINMPRNGEEIDEETMKDDDERQCCICNHSCYFSSIICSCNPQRLTCLRHAQFISFLLINYLYIIYILL